MLSEVSATHEDLGGDPPCWEGLIEDYRDRRSDRLADIETRTDVHDLVVAFYREVVFDELLEPLFGDVAEVDWAEHIPKLIDYWCWILLGTPGHASAMFGAHRHLHGLSAIGARHCDRWFYLWCRTIDEGWEGPRATRSKEHAQAIMEALAKRVFGFRWRPGDDVGSGSGLLYSIEREIPRCPEHD